MIGDDARGTVLVIGGSDAVGSALGVDLVADGWTVVRTPSWDGGDAGALDALWTTPQPPQAFVLVLNATDIGAANVERIAEWVARLGSGGCAVLLREYATAGGYAETLTERALTGVTEELARRAAPARRVNAVYGAPRPATGEGLPRRRLGTPEDLAAAATFLAGRASQFVTGVTLRLDGGAALNWSLSGL